MKKIIIILGLIIGGSVSSQITIGTDETSSDAVSLEFGEGDLGMALPMVEDATNVEGDYGGTLIYDLKDNKVKVYLGEGNSGTWMNLTNSGNLQNTPTDTSIQDNRTENAEAKVGIGTPTNKKGILVLEDTDKAMVLPLVQKPYYAIEDPVAGTMAYDPDEQILAAFNGEKWYFWGAQNTFKCGDDVTFDYNGQQVTYGTVESAGGQCWMDRNLGATQVATSLNDSDAYGDYFQWGRDADGHQNKNSGVTTTTSSTDDPGHGDFIKVAEQGMNWRVPKNDDLWQGSEGINNPCPAGFRIPKLAEWQLEANSWSLQDSQGAFDSDLKLTVPGGRVDRQATMYKVGETGWYWSSDIDPQNPDLALDIVFNDSGVDNHRQGGRADGLSVRCIKD